MVRKPYAFPALTARFIPVWQRNLLVWRKLAIPSILGTFADPLIYMLGLGYGLGRLVPEVGGMSYIVFIAGGTICFSTMNAATFEAMYSGFSRMHVQRTWEAIMNAPITLDDVALAELLWATTKSFLSGLAILIVAWGLGLTSSPLSLWILAIIPVTGLAFAALALAITALADGYDFFMYYFTLVITPMTMLCGVFFPVAQLPPALQALSSVLPLTHATELVRPLILGEAPADVGLHAGALLAYAIAGFYAAVVLFRRRLLK
jgi:lipooligosaccharide transport system permease protein